LYYLDAVLTDVPPNVRDYLDILRTQIGLSEQIVTDLLDFARVKSPERTEVSLEELVTEQLKRADVPANIHVETMFPPELPPVCIDRVQMGQVVLNLITNAVQAMVGTRAPADVAGNLVLRAEAVDDHQVELQVRDSGPGVAPEHLEKIFEPLFTTKARGIGLGLAVSRTLARANGGDITVSSKPGAGACFSLTLPVTQEVHA
jgi:signal transduction histidine kinase